MYINNSIPWIHVLKVGYGINYKYEGTLSHLSDRFYIVTKFELPKVEDLKLTMISYDSTCQYLEDAKSLKHFLTKLIREMKNYCIKIAPYVDNYQKQIDYYNWAAYEIMTNLL